MPCSKLHCQKALNSIHLSHKITNLILQVAGEGRGGDPGAAARQLHALDRHQHQAAGKKRGFLQYPPAHPSGWFWAATVIHLLLVYSGRV